jgi:RNA polymerase sigma-70 factor (ECF subfamily)
MKILDPQTFSAFQRGDHQAFQTVYEQFRSLLYVVILSIVKHEATTEDLLQDTFLKIYQKGHLVRDPSKFQAWIVMIAKRTALNELKRNKEETWQDAYDNTPSREDGKSLFQTWHHNLTDEENLIVAYKIVYDLGFEDIAKLMDASLSHVYKVYQQALTKLKVMYKK